MQPITPENVHLLTKVAYARGDRCSDLAWSPDSQTLAIASAQGVFLLGAALWQMIEGNLGQTRQPDPNTPDLPVWIELCSPMPSGGEFVNTGGAVTRVSFAADGCALYTWDAKGSPHTWDLPGGAELPLPDPQPLPPSLPANQPLVAPINHEYNLCCLTSCCPNADQIASIGKPASVGLLAGGEFDRVQLWDGANGRLLTSLTTHHGQILAVAFSPDGHLLAAASHHQARVWGVA